MNQGTYFEGRIRSQNNWFSTLDYYNNQVHYWRNMVDWPKSCLNNNDTYSQPLSNKYPQTKKKDLRILSPTKMRLCSIETLVLGPCFTHWQSLLLVFGVKIDRDSTSMFILYGKVVETQSTEKYIILLMTNSSPLSIYDPRDNTSLSSSELLTYHLLLIVQPDSIGLCSFW